MQKSLWKENTHTPSAHRIKVMQATVLTPGQRHFHRKGHRVVALTPHPRHIHRRSAPSHWHCTDPCFAPDFALMLLAAAALIALIYLFSLAADTRIITPDELPGHPAVLFP